MQMISISQYYSKFDQFFCKFIFYKEQRNHNQMNDNSETQLNVLLKDILFKLFNQSQAKKKLPPMFQNSFMECSDNIQIARLIAYIIDSYFLRISEPNTTNSTPLSHGENDSTEYQSLEKQLQKYQAQVRQHIRNEQTMRLHCQQLEQRVQQLQRQNKKYKQPIKSQRLRQISLEKSQNFKNNHYDNSIKSTAQQKEKHTLQKRTCSKRKFHKKQTIETDTYRQSIPKHNLTAKNKSARASKDKKDSFSNTKKMSKNHKNTIDSQLNLQAINVQSQIVRSARINSMRSTLPNGVPDSILKPNKSKHHNICSKKQY